LLTLATYPELRAALGGAAAVPDFRGLFLRGLGSQNHAQENGSTVGVTSTTHVSGALGSVQGDANRNIMGEIATSDGDVEHLTFADNLQGMMQFSGAIWYSNHRKSNFGLTGGGNWGFAQFNLDSSMVVPVANENRPVNTSVRYLIRALP
jgi:hypothetical protein